MTDLPEVRNLYDLLKDKLRPGEEIVGKEVSRLTAPGENYGSVMLRILLRIKDSNNLVERILDLVGKTIPQNEKIKEVFNTSVTFKNEYKFYEIIVPILDRVLKNHGFQQGADFIAPFYGGRLSLDKNGQVDDDAVILLKNMKTAGYIIGGKKSEGLDFEAAKCTLDSLVKLHAAGIALKQQQRNLFDTRVRPYLGTYAPDKLLFQVVTTNVIRTLENAGFAKTDLAKVQAAFQRSTEKTNVSDLWGTMIHYDTWTNNILLKYEDSHPAHCILVDFQVGEYGTPLDDVMFFLFTSIPQGIFLEIIDILLIYYYEKFIGVLKQLGVNTDKYTKDSFDAEVRIAVKNYEYVHTMWMLQPLMDEEFKSVEDLSRISIDKPINWSEKHVEKIETITRLCLDRDWL